jgi:C4-dicarboxylate transporter DctM subunit
MADTRVSPADGLAAGRSLLARFVTPLGGLGSLLFISVAVIIVYEVVMRFVFRAPTMWVAEISSLLTIVAAFLIFAYTLQERGHTRVDFVTAHLSKGSAFLLELFTAGLGALLCAILAWYGVKMVHSSYVMGEQSQTLQLPLWIPQAFVPLGGLLMLLELLRVLGADLHRLRQGALATLPGGDRPRVYLPLLVFAGTLGLGLLLLTSWPKTALTLLFFTLLFNGMPVSYAMGLFGTFGLFVLLGGETALINVPMIAYNTVDSILIVAFPLFLLSGTILEAGQVGPRIFHFANTLVRHLPGGMGIAAIIFCGIFAAMTGSSVAVAAAVSVIALPEMLKRGYDRKISIGLLAAGGTLGILFPPSLALIFYSAITFESLGALFLAAVVPGLILTGFFIAYMVVVGLRDPNIQRDPRASLGELIVILIIMGGIYSGLFTPTEAGAVAVLYSIFLCTFWYQTLPWPKLKACILKAGKISGMIILIIIGANITGNLITMTQITQDLLKAINALALPSWLYLVFILIFLIILGGPLEAVSIMVITCPILYPVIKALGFDGLWFGIIMAVVSELALISPPEGINLFILQEIGKATAAEVSRGVIPFLVLMGLFLALISFFPGLTTWLPALTR